MSLAPLHQPHNLAPIRIAAEQLPDAAAGRLLRYRLSPRPRRAGRPLRDPAPAPCRGRQALRLPRPVLRIYRQAPAAGRAGHRRRAGDRRPSRQRRLDVRDARTARSVESTMGFTALDGLADGNAAGPARSRRRALSDRGKGHARVERAELPLPRLRPEGPVRRQQRHARARDQRRTRARRSRSTISSTGSA